MVEVQKISGASTFGGIKTVFMDIEIDFQPAGRLTIELYAGMVPKTVEVSELRGV